MSVYSMTGYGSATNRAAVSGDEVTPAPLALTVDVRSVNGRFLDLTITLPDEARALESGLRDLLTSRVKRGKVEMRVAFQREGEGGITAPSPEQLMQLARLEDSVRAYFGKAAPLSVHDVLLLTRQSTPVARQDDEALRVAKLAIDAMVESRRREGDKLVTALRAGADRVRALALQAQPLVASVVQRQQQRFLERWQDALKLTNAGAEVSTTAAAERALGEAATYALRIDVAEELTRLNAHLDELDALLKKGGELGKRLDFLIQEMHREANTLGAKSQALELSTISMDMRVAIEQMREQVQNLE